MATPRTTATETTATEPTDPAPRRCIGSARFGIEAHDAPVEDFPVQPSRRDGLGLLCREHWTAYTRGLRRAARERRTEVVEEAVGEVLVAAAGTVLERETRRIRPRTPKRDAIDAGTEEVDAA